MHTFLRPLARSASNNLVLFRHRKFILPFLNTNHLSFRHHSSEAARLPESIGITDKEPDTDTLKKKKKKNNNNNNITQVLSPELLSENEITSILGSIKGVTIVRDEATALSVLEKLRSPELRDRYHACDTEVAGIDVKKESPCGHGTVICASIYCGPDVDFGNGPIIWIDNLDSAEGTLDLFKPYFEDESIRKTWHNYSFDRHVLYNHAIDVKGFGADTMHMARLWDSSRLTKGGYSLEALSNTLLPSTSRKIPYPDLFGHNKIRVDGTEGKVRVVPPVDEIQRTGKFLAQWVDYSANDAKVTWDLRNVLEEKLHELPWWRQKTMFHFYDDYWRPFGELLTDMEREGVRVDLDHLAQIESEARRDKEGLESNFRNWLEKVSGPDVAWKMNINSDNQLRHLLFGEAGTVKEFEVLNEEGIIEEGKKKAKKNRKIPVEALGFTTVTTTTSGAPQVNSTVLKALAGEPNEQPPILGLAAKTNVPNSSAIQTCRALANLTDIGSIETLLTSFIVPLQVLPSEREGRVHTSMNINTETGRLSCRRPNLQNQPALEKDRYRIRRAFTCRPGNKMIAADYGQLELRLLAHITNCKSMLDAFREGGDFHSRTAIGMYPKVREAIERGDVLLEWDKSKGQAPAPLLKDVYAIERRRAKVLNFSIAYGKTAHGLSKDWGVSLKEAKEILKLWYADRPEVEAWQKRTIAEAHETTYTRTLMGRYRLLSDINSRSPAMKSHSERASINTPLQGGAADVVMKAMLKLHSDQRLRELGWKLLLQIHDELILEGPQENANEALSIVVEHMRNPLEPPLLVELVVDARIADNWMEAK
eukprot:TRINITY_DN1712_c1_g1_i1.p1 TRINITY_DN1712_c1_g1~~TRINITY_DN1712_c1_g1_i1.p1  ORF type:complete len:821 (-),score=173.14 TRINITY_DN1712_c1_g1_i1:74-2536(-)